MIRVSDGRAWLAVAALWSALVGDSVAKDCPERFRIAFQDETKGCLTDYPIAEESPAGRIGALRWSIPGDGFYALAAAPGGGECRRALGLGLTGGGVQSLMAQLVASPDRQRDALRSCARLAAASSEPCACTVILADGRSPLTESAFRSVAAATGVATRQPVEPPKLAARPATQEVTSEGGSGKFPESGTVTRQGSSMESGPVARKAPELQADSAVGPQAEIAALRQQIDQLRVEVSRASAERTATKATEGGTLRARALVIGNSAYTSLGALANPRRDAQSIAAKFRSFGIDVDLVLDADRPALVQALTRYQQRSSGYDVNLLFYAGHGLQVNGVNYIVPVDLPAVGTSVGGIRLNAISLNDALEYLPAGIRVVFLDACRDNPLSRSLVATRSSGSAGLAPVAAVSGTLVSYATKDGSTAEDGVGRNSPYTAALLRHLDAPEDIAVVLRRVRETVLRSTARRQEPWEYGSLVGDRLVLAKLSR